MKKIFTLLLLAIFLTAKAAPPNIIFILADDVGIDNIACYGADHFKTPNIDALAHSGIRFEYSYAAPLCGPSRCEILTGRYAFHTGMTGNDSGSLIKPGHEIMMPKIMKAAGYVTASVGKWGQLPVQPGDFGFDEYFRFQGSGVYWPGEKNDLLTINGKHSTIPKGKYVPDMLHEFVVDFLHRHKDEPFYLYYPMSSVHAQIERTPDSPPHSQDLYADNIAYMDKLVGKLMDELDRLKLREKTLVFFAGDNGTASKPSTQSFIGGRHVSGHKGELLEGGSRVPLIASWPGTTPAGKYLHDLTDFSDFYPTIAEVAGAKLPAGVTIDGHSFAPQLRGQTGRPRDWIFVELGKHWYVRDAKWKLTEAGKLFDMSGAPFEEKLVEAGQQEEARKNLQAVLDQLNPAGGKVDPGDGSGRHARKLAKKAKKQKI